MDFLWNITLVAVLGYIAFELGILIKYLQERHMPIGRNEEIPDLEGANEKEPRHQV